MNKISEKGFLTFVQNSNSVDYLELAYLQALSIKLTQPKYNLYAIAVDENTKLQITEEQKRVFDYVIDIPDDAAYSEAWKLSNEWKAFILTPFKETLKVESDLLFTTDITHWWQGMQLTDMCFSSHIRDYTGNISTNRTYRKIFDDNNLPDVYNGLMYFRYTKTTADFFTYAKEIFENWDIVKTEILKNCRDDSPTTDVVYGLAASLIGEEKCINPALSYPTFAHMKGAINGMPMSADWTEHLYYQIDDNFDFLIDNVKQQYPVHYYIKDLAKKLLPRYIDEYNRRKSV